MREECSSILDKEPRKLPDKQDDDISSFPQLSLHQHVTRWWRDGWGFSEHPPHGLFNLKCDNYKFVIFFVFFNMFVILCILYVSNLDCMSIFKMPVIRHKEINDNQSINQNLIGQLNSSLGLYLTFNSRLNYGLGSKSGLQYIWIYLILNIKWYEYYIMNYTKLLQYMKIY